MPDEPEPPPEDLAEVGRYPRFSHAQERGLVAAALEVPYWVIRKGRDFVLYVEPACEQRVREELAVFEAERARRQDEQTAPPARLPKLDTTPLFIAAFVMSMYWAGQNLAPEQWMDRGDAANHAILSGEWWRTITALTLHGDLPHFIANLGFGLMFASFLIPRFGGGGAWLGIILSGAAGNGLNAWFYRREPHDAIGASTAVFGGLGMLAAWELMERWRTPGRRGWWHLVVPLGGGLALLAYLGVGDEHEHTVDYMAHLWGFLCGVLLGLATGGRRPSPAAQRVAGALALALPLAAWALALRG